MASLADRRSSITGARLVRQAGGRRTLGVLVVAVAAVAAAAGLRQLYDWPAPVPRAVWRVDEVVAIPFAAPILSSTSWGTFTPAGGGGPRPMIDEGGRVLLGLRLHEGADRSRDARLMLDTGTSTCALAPSIIAGLDRSLRWYRVRGEPTALGGAGDFRAFMRKLPALEIPGAGRVENLGVIECPLGGDGILAPSCFPGRSIVIDFPRERVSLVPPAAVAALLDRPGTVVVRARRSVEGLFIPLTLDGTQVEALVDTGAPRSFVRSLPGVAARSGGEAPLGVVVRVGIGGVDTGPHLVAVHSSYRTSADLGMNILQALGRPVLFDLEGSRFALLPAE